MLTQYEAYYASKRGYLFIIDTQTKQTDTLMNACTHPVSVSKDIKILCNSIYFVPVLT